MGYQRPSNPNARMRRVIDAFVDQAAGNRYKPLKLRREPDSFYEAPRSNAPVTLPRVKWLERPDP